MILTTAASFAVLAAPALATENQLQSISFATALIEPYQALDQNGKLEGLALPIISCVMNKLDTAFTIEVLPWARAQKNVELGVHDAFFVASRNAVRDAYAKPSEPLFSGLRSWVFRPGYVADPDTAEFKQQGRVGSIFGTNMHAWLDKNYSNVVAKSSEQDLLALLVAGRVDAVLVTDAMYEHMLESNQNTESAFNVRPHAPKPLGVYFGNQFLTKHPQILDQFNSALPDCTKES